MAHAYGSLCDDFYVNISLTTEMALPRSRETVLHFFECIQKELSPMTRFYRGEQGELTLEEDRDSGSYRWITIESDRLRSGHVNPDRLEDTYRQHALVLELAPYHLTLSDLDANSLDVLFGFDFNYTGNHDDIVAEAVFRGSPLGVLADLPGARPIDYQPSIVVGMDDTCGLQARLSIETRTSSYQVRTGEYANDPISVYLTVRQFWSTALQKTFCESFRQQCEIAEDLLNTHVLGQVVNRVAEAIATRH